MALETAGGETLRLQEVTNEDGTEVRLYCHSPGREQKEQAITARFIGRLKARSHGISQPYQVELEADGTGRKLIALRWQQQPVAGTMLTDPGVYCLRSNDTGWGEEALWRTYRMLTDLEAVFRSFKSELGLRPIFHAKEIRTELKKHGIDASWTRLRQILSVQRRVIATFRQADGRTLNVRKNTLAEPDLLTNHQALGLNAAPGGTRKLIT